MCTCGAICGDGHTNRPWWPTEQRLSNWSDATVVTDCCLRQLPASETICRLRCQELPLGGYGDYQERDPWPPHKPVNWFSYASYYDASWRIECNPEGERSCKQHKRFLRGLHLREWRYEAA
jgi:hypothetical protein